jgi:hypothetical protein
MITRLSNVPSKMKSLNLTGQFCQDVISLISAAKGKLSGKNVSVLTVSLVIEVVGGFVYMMGVRERCVSVMMTHSIVYCILQRRLNVRVYKWCKIKVSP